jgi:hypothetical protein
MSGEGLAGPRSWSRTGRTTTGSVPLSLVVRPAKAARRLRPEIAATDPLGNERKTSGLLKL